MRYALSHFSHVWLFVTLWTVAHQVPLSMEFSRQEYWSGLPCPPPRDVPNPGIQPMSLMLLAGGFFTNSATWEAIFCLTPIQILTVKTIKKCIQGLTWPCQPALLNMLLELACFWQKHPFGINNTIHTVTIWPYTLLSHVLSLSLFFSGRTPPACLDIMSNY